jgi:hypothetical protein
MGALGTHWRLVTLDSEETPDPTDSLNQPSADASSTPSAIAGVKTL